MTCNGVEDEWEQEMALKKTSEGVSNMITFKATPSLLEQWTTIPFDVQLMLV